MRQSVFEVNFSRSYYDKAVTTIYVPCTLVDFNVSAWSWLTAAFWFAMRSISCYWMLGGATSMPKMMSLVSDIVRLATLTLFFLA